MLRKTLFQIFLSIIFASLLLSIDSIIFYLGVGKNKVLGLAFPIIITLISIFITFTRSKAFISVLLLMLGILHLSNILHLAYFGSEITPEEIRKFFADPVEDVYEIFLTGYDSFKDIYKPSLVIVFSYFTIGFLYFRYYKNFFKFSFSPVIITLMLLITPIRAITHPSPYLFYPSPTNSSLLNILNSLSLSIAKSHFKISSNNYKDITLIKTSPKAKNIVLLMGESLNPEVMSLFGFDYETTPLLGRRKLDKNFIYKEGYSSAVCTNVALQMFFNLVYEPNNPYILNSKVTNLFRLAKEQGYKTFLVSMQSASLFYLAGTEFIDVFLSKELFEKDMLEKDKDEILIRELGKFNLSEKNFIVLHQRAIHAPYSSNYLHKTQSKLFEIDNLEDRVEVNKKTYMNAVKHNEVVIDKVIESFIQTFKSKGESYFFMTSDHGELMGDQGLFGHNHLVLGCAKVPFLVYSLNGDKAFMDSIAKTHLLTHYNLGSLIADRLGITIINPNREENIYFVHGDSILPGYKYIKYKLEN